MNGTDQVNMFEKFNVFSASHSYRCKNKVYTI